MRLGYNSNGFPQHRLEDVARLLARLGYDAIAITPDVFHLDPFGSGPAEAQRLGPLLRDLGLAVAVETGARFVLDPARKHQPTLLSEPADAARRLEMLRRCLDLAVTLRAETLSFWSGAPAAEEVPRAELLERLCRGAEALLDAAAGSGVALAFEPEPGMLVASLADLDEFLARLRRPELGVMLDVGHVPVTEEIAPEQAVRRLGARLAGLQLDDCRGRRHEHLLPGEGEVDFRALVRAAAEGGFAGLACLELPRHAHDPVRTAERALAHLRGCGA